MQGPMAACRVVAPSLRSDAATGLGGWSEDDIVTYLRTGRIDQSAVFGAMADVVAWSTRYMTDADLRATAHYLKSLPADAAPAAAAAAVSAGQGLYAENCALCHGDDGAG